MTHRNKILALLLAGLIVLAYFLLPKHYLEAQKSEKVGSSVERTWNTDTRQVNGSKQTEIHSKWINYLDNNSFQPIDTSFKDCGNFFCIGGAPFKVEIPKTSVGTAKFINDNRYDVFTGETITDPSVTQSITALGVSEVSGRIESGDVGFGSANYVIYDNAYPSLNADLIYYVHHGKAPRLMKLVRFKTALNPAQDIRLDFDISYSSPMEIETRKTSLTNGEKNQYAAFLEAARLKETQKRTQSEVYTEEFKALALLKSPWNQQSLVTTKRAISQKVVGSTGKRGIGFKDFSIWDSGKGPNKKSQLIDVEYSKTQGNTYRLTKIVPKTFLTSSVQYPLYTDTTSTFYPDANPETTSVDGTARREGQNEIWTSMVNGTGSSAGDTDVQGVFVNVDATATTDKYLQNYRYIVLFDTSSIPDTDTVSAAEIDLAGDGSAEQAALQLTNYVVVTSNPASNTGLVGSDYQTRGTTANSGTFALASWVQTSGTYNVHALDATGISNISKTGVSKFAFVFDKDRSDTAPTWSSSGNAYISCFFADNTGTDADPKLIVTHAVAANNRRIIPISFLYDLSALSTALLSRLMI